MFGFPESLEEFELKHYIRLVIIICGYLVVRPAIESIYKKLYEKDRIKQAKKEQEEQARKHKEQRIKEKLGIAYDEPIPAEEQAKAATTATEEQRASVAQMLRRKPKAERKKLEAIHDDMISDEDVGELIARVDSSKED